MSVSAPRLQPPSRHEPVPAELKVLQPRPRTAVVEVLGEHDLATSDATRELFTRLVAKHELLIVDLSETAYIDSSFLNNLKNAQHAADDQGHTVVLQVGTASIVKRLLEITLFLTRFDHVSSREEALAWAQPADEPSTTPTTAQPARTRDSQPPGVQTTAAASTPEIWLG